MIMFKLLKRFVLVVLLLVVSLLVLVNLYFLVLGGLGGGWDIIVCGVGEVMVKVGIEDNVLF